MSNFVKALDNMYNLIRGENGAPCHASSNNPGLDLFFKSVRDISDDELNKLIINVLNSKNSDNVADVFVQMFQVRNCRGGKGEKDLSYKMLFTLYNKYPETIISLVHLYKDYGYWKDLINILELINEKDDKEKYVNLMNKIILVFANQLKDDKIKMDNNEKNVSLAAKWAPRENHNFSKKNKEIFNNLLSTIFPDVKGQNRFKEYRKLIVGLNAYINTVEVLMCSGNWKEINYSHVPSVNLKKWRKAHLNELIDKKNNEGEYENTGNRYPDNEDRVIARNNLLNIVRDGSKKLSGKQLMPHEITNIYYKGKNITSTESELLQKQWDSLKLTVLTKGRKAIPLSDVSSSMDGIPMEVSIALGILLSEVTHEAFRDRVITFHESPSWVDLSKCNSLSEKVNTLKNASWGGSTNIEKVFDMILDIAIKNKLSSEDIPDLVIFSDMQFNIAIGSRDGNTNTHLNIVKNKFKKAGLVCPRIVFWNLRAATGFPATQDAENVMMLSGFSPSLLKFILEDELVNEPTPLETYLAVINDKQYDPIRVILNNSNEGLLSNYKFNIVI